ncbi:hypothetical protein PHYSODRAFT_252690 [Phytophthora sojae]|uniref:Uncharacterized protein n=1 Tax=Phytophthora sojae (strain P6497) TaxID=1094619 RepID=G4YN01_PHYSP|nr:hypothetical protein PHYSODRAFT_252690 [Phytophthora sojae]EGZ29534.1 hypothetical protein PHYSODRAFT_252690 [Phytophthora sojae]|eukprot:XP_009516809.1 hypothetical protein PHYSODRAFT_252690 [Phytophthora sojae]
MQPPSGRSSHQAASGFAQVLRAAAGAESQADCVGQQRVSAGSSQDLRAPTGPSLLEQDLKLGKQCSSASRPGVLPQTCKQPLELVTAKNEKCKSESQPEVSAQTCEPLLEQATAKGKQYLSESEPEALHWACNQLLELHRR